MSQQCRNSQGEGQKVAKAMVKQGRVNIKKLEGEGQGALLEIWGPREGQGDLQEHSAQEDHGAVLETWWSREGEAAVRVDVPREGQVDG